MALSVMLQGKAKIDRLIDCLEIAFKIKPKKKPKNDKNYNLPNFSADYQSSFWRTYSKRVIFYITTVKSPCLKTGDLFALHLRRLETANLQV